MPSLASTGREKNEEDRQRANGFLGHLKICCVPFAFSNSLSVLSGRAQAE
jgi:hypothetical protein